MLSAEEQLRGARARAVRRSCASERRAHVRALQRIAERARRARRRGRARRGRGALRLGAARGRRLRPAGARSGARHPVVERLLPRGEFVPNDCALDGAARQILLLTGPNMGGKSTYLRQVALARAARAGRLVRARRARRDRASSTGCSRASAPPTGSARGRARSWSR